MGLKIKAKKKRKKKKSSPDVFTESWRRLQVVAHQLAPSNGVDVRRLVVYPLVELVLPAVEVDQQEAAHAALHRGDAHQPRLHQVHGLQLHVGGETVAWVVLRKNNQKQKTPQGVMVYSIYTSKTFPQTYWNLK